jgi:hypothetical protein
MLEEQVKQCSLTYACERYALLVSIQEQFARTPGQKDRGCAIASAVVSHLTVQDYHSLGYKFETITVRIHL